MNFINHLRKNFTHFFFQKVEQETLPTHFMRSDFFFPVPKPDKDNTRKKPKKLQTDIHEHMHHDS